jgi:hypothetical protein
MLALQRINIRAEMTTEEICDHLLNGIGEIQENIKTKNFMEASNKSELASDIAWLKLLYEKMEKADVTRS